MSGVATAGRDVTEAELAAAGRALAAALAPGAVVWLEGQLGAGKTTFAQAVVAGLGAGARATSPTYSLVHRYDGRRGPVYHVDCFRLRDPDEAGDLDWDGLSTGDALLVEWPERARAWVPPPDHRVRLAHVADRPELRRLVITSGA